jgi:hypothetical protein
MVSNYTHDGCTDVAHVNMVITPYDLSYILDQWYSTFFPPYP